MSPSKSSSHTMHDPCLEARDLIAAYSIGATDREETLLVEAALNDCPELAAEMAEYLALSDVMLHLVPQTEEPPALADLPDVLKQPPRHQLTQAEQHHYVPNEPVITHLHTSAPAVPVANHRKVVPLETRDTREKPTRQPGRTWFFAAAAVAALFVLTNLYWFTQLGDLRQVQDSLQAQIDAQAAEQPQMVRVPVTAQHQRDLTATNVGIEGAHATVLWNAGNAIGSLHVTGLPHLQNNNTYQLWLVRGDEAVSMGTFEVSDDGTGIVVFEAPEPIESYETIGISVEPGDGSQIPTTPHVVIGDI